ncbi:MAG: hypothetical protein HYR90_00335 [Candidatus Andersenbacteria bacterium]|nr:hypothetical protein [Candidatus Andersenbacteria bacterium]MBI3250686.1 hypothetical protein [Candidatus Andersenbacteria bacterium]
MTLRLMVVIGVGITALAIVAGVADYYGFLSLGRTAVLSGNDVKPVGLYQPLSCVHYPNTGKFVTPKLQVINPTAADRTMTVRLYYNSKFNNPKANSPVWAKTLKAVDVSSEPYLQNITHKFDSGVEWGPITIPKAISRSDLLSKAVTYAVDIHPQIALTPQNNDGLSQSYLFIIRYKDLPFFDSKWGIARTCLDNEQPKELGIQDPVDVSANWAPPQPSPTFTITPKPTAAPTSQPTVAPRPTQAPVGTSISSSTPSPTPSKPVSPPTEYFDFRAVPAPTIPVVSELPIVTAGAIPQCYTPDQPFSVIFGIVTPSQMVGTPMTAQITLPAGRVESAVPTTYQQLAGNKLHWITDKVARYTQYVVRVVVPAPGVGTLEVPFLATYQFPRYLGGSPQEKIRIPMCDTPGASSVSSVVTTETPSVIQRVTEFFTGASVVTPTPMVNISAPTTTAVALQKPIEGNLENTIVMSPSPLPEQKPSVVRRIANFFTGNTATPSPKPTPVLSTASPAKVVQLPVTSSIAPPTTSLPPEYGIVSVPEVNTVTSNPPEVTSVSPFVSALKSLGQQALETAQSLISLIANWQGVANKSVE